MTTVPALLWADQPEVVQAVTGRSPRTLKREKGLQHYTRGSGSNRRTFWITTEVINYFIATSTPAIQTRKEIEL